MASIRYDDDDPADMASTIEGLALEIQAVAKVRDERAAEVEKERDELQERVNELEAELEDLKRQLAAVERQFEAAKRAAEWH